MRGFAVQCAAAAILDVQQKSSALSKRPAFTFAALTEIHFDD